MPPPALSAGMTSALNITPVLDALARLDIDGGRVLTSVGASLEALREPHARVPATLELAFWDALLEHTRDPLIALRVAEQIQVGALGGYEYLMRTSETVRAAIEQANKFERVMDDLTRIRIIEDAQSPEAAIRLFREGGWPHPPLGTECLFACVVRLVEVTLPGEHVLSLRFAHSAKADPRDYAERLGCPVAFDTEHNDIVVRRAALELPVCTADPALSRVLEEHMTHVLAHLPEGEEPVVARARLLLAEALREKGDVSLEQLARSMHMSERTLRRRLEEHGTSYKSLLDELRRELACHYVARTSETFDETGARLGFADISAFYRAFKRWTSTTPAAYRAARLQKPISGSRARSQ